MLKTISKRTANTINNCQLLNKLKISYYPVDNNLHGLSDQHIKLRQTVFNLAQTELSPLVQDIENTKCFKNFRTFMKQLGNLGYLGTTVDKIYGGTASGYLSQVLVVEELSRVSAAVGLKYAVHSNLCMNQIQQNGNEKQKHKYLPKLCQGKYLGAIAMSETEAGSDVVSMKLKAEKKGDDYILNGSKFWISNGPEADVLIVYAKTDFSVSAHKGISAFIVEKNFAGFFSGPSLDTMGVRGLNTAQLFFDNCKVPKENLLGGENKGVYVLMTGLDYERLVLAATPLGIMQACCDVVFKYTHEQQHETEPTDFKMKQCKLVDMCTTLGACRSYLYNVAKACDQNAANRRDCAAVILYCAEKATQMALDAIGLLGTDGYVTTYPTGRFLRDAKLLEIGAGTTEIRKIVIASSLRKYYE